jgi:REP element-mobilizing transposase RayT
VKYNPAKHHRQSIRLKGYDYSSSGAYFITLCTHQRQCLFGEIVAGEMQLNPYGEIVAEEWQRTLEIRANFAIDAWIVMPNHFHGIVIIDHSDQIDHSDRSLTAQRTHGSAPLPNSLHRRPQSLSSFVAGFKSITTKRINTIRNAAGTPVWQRNYYERIIRDRDSAAKIRQYIQNNPSVWAQDQLHPNNP